MIVFVGLTAFFYGMRISLKKLAGSDIICRLSMSQEVSSGIIIYRKTPDGPRFLLLYHGRNHWSFPKGHIEAGEQSFKAALREVEEETGLRSRDLKLKDFFKIRDRFFLWRDGKKVFKIVTLYLAETANPKIVISHEHQGYGWFLYKEALKVAKYDSIRKILKSAYDAISGKSVSGGRAYPARPGRNLRGYRPGGRASRSGEGGGAGAPAESPHSQNTLP